MNEVLYSKPKHFTLPSFQDNLHNRQRASRRPNDILELQSWVCAGKDSFPVSLLSLAGIAAMHHLQVHSPTSSQRCKGSRLWKHSPDFELVDGGQFADGRQHGVVQQDPGAGLHGRHDLLQDLGRILIGPVVEHVAQQIDVGVTHRLGFHEVMDLVRDTACKMSRERGDQLFLGLLQDGGEVLHDKLQVCEFLCNVDAHMALGAADLR